MSDAYDGNDTDFAACLKLISQGVHDLMSDTEVHLVLRPNTYPGRRTMSHSAQRVVTGCGHLKAYYVRPMEFSDPQVILFVADTERAASFYGIFGFRETFRSPRRILSRSGWLWEGSLLAWHCHNSWRRSTAWSL